jgi:PHD/YefM family antitoxin component YafN of YafNO toxin-antitoxin module
LYDARKEACMIELTEQQIQALANSDSTSPCLINPRTNETFVLVRVDEYQRLKEGDYDDSPWTRDELEAASREVAKRTDWDEMGDYDAATGES